MDENFNAQTIYNALADADVVVDPQEASNLQDVSARSREVDDLTSSSRVVTNPTHITSDKINESFLEQLMNMGFPYNGCVRALIQINNTSVEAALEWIFAHMEDNDFDDSVEKLLNPSSLYMDVFVASHIFEFWNPTGKTLSPNSITLLSLL